jgi:hypothetical protein
VVYPAGIVRGALVVMVLVLGLAASPLRAVEQTVSPLTPPAGQTVEALAPSQVQHVEAVDPPTGQDVSGPVIPPSAGQKAAETTGKVAVGFLAVVLSLAAMAAQIIFI